MGATNGTQTPKVERSYAGTTDTLNQARLDVAELLSQHDLHALIADAQLIVSELTSNAVHASPGLAYRVITTIRADDVVISVVNNSSGDLPAAEDWKPDTPLAPQGRGLAIVKALSRRVDVKTTGTQVVVSAHLRIVDG